MAFLARFTILIFSGLTLLSMTAGCSRSASHNPGDPVQIEDLKFEKSEPRKPVWKWIERGGTAKPISDQKTPVPVIEIIYGKIHFDKLQATKNDKGLVVTGDFYFDKKKIASDIQFETVEVEGFKTFLQTTNPDLKRNLKAAISCLEDIEPGAECKEFFIDFYYQADGKTYSDQFVIDQESEAALQAAREKQQAKEKKPTQPQVKDAAPAEPSPPQATTEPEEADEDEEEPALVEEEDHNHAESTESEGVVIDQGAYVGTPMLDLWKLFYNDKATIDRAIQPPAAETGSDKKAGSDNSVPTPDTKDSPVKQDAKQTEPKKDSTSPAVPKAEPTQPKQDQAQPTAPTNQRPMTELPKEARITSNQSIGTPQRGALSNATNFLEYAKHPQSVFKMLATKRKRYYANFNLLTVVNDLGKVVRSQVPGYQVAIKDLSPKRGGKTGHLSHQNGVDADIRYITKSDGPDLISVVHNGKVTDDLLLVPQWEVFKRLVATDWVVMIYVDKKVKSALCEYFKSTPDAKIPEKVTEAKRVFRYLDDRSSGHHNHFHLRIQCGDNQPRCRIQKYLMPETKGFKDDGSSVTCENKKA